MNHGAYYPFIGMYTQEIAGEDIRLAVTLSDGLKMRQDSRVQILLQSQEYINQKSLIESICKRDGVLNRYPKDFMNRTFTYIPGNEAYSTNVRKAILEIKRTFSPIF